MHSRLSALALVTVVAATALVNPPSTSNGSQDPAQETDLEQRVSNLEALVVQQQVELEEAHAQLAALNDVADGLVQACADLDQAMVSSRKNGFEWAGPNPQAKTDMLDGIRQFTRQVRVASGVEVPADEPEDGDGGAP